MKFHRSTPLLILVGAIALYGATAVFTPSTAAAAGTCCTYGQDCPGDQGCYFPTSGEAACSPDNPNYCSGAAIQ
jgi:hypothetical protein